MPIVSFGVKNPLVDGRQSENALMVQRGMTLHLEQTGHVVLAEFPLASGRRADLLAMDRKGSFTLIEIKSSLEDFRADSKWPQYRQFCDRFHFATHGAVDSGIFPEEEGLCIADQHGAHIFREAREERMAPATRRALTLRFARLAAARLSRVSAFGLANGLNMESITSASEEE